MTFYEWQILLRGVAIGFILGFVWVFGLMAYMQNRHRRINEKEEDN